MKCLFVIAVLTILLTGCGEKVESGHEKFLSNEQWGEVVEEIVNEVDLPALMFLSEKEINHLMGIDTDDLKSYLVLMPMMRVHASQILVFQIKEGKMGTIKAAVDAYFEAYEQQWTGSLSEQYDLIKKRLEKTVGNTLIVIIADDVETIESKINEVLNSL